MTTSQVANLLIVSSLPDSAEQLTNALRDAGCRVQGRQVDSKEALHKALAQQRWDAALCQHTQDSEPVYTDLLLTLKQENLDIPVLLLTETDDVQWLTRGLTAGCTDVILPGQNERLTRVLQRELDSLDQRRRCALAEQSANELEARNTLLLASSRECIAYVHQGMHICANDAYANLFGYETGDDMLAIALLDVIESEHVEEFMAHLSEFEHGQGDAQLNMHCVHQDDTTFEAGATLSFTRYEGERCFQILVRPVPDPAADAAKLKEMLSKDPRTGLLSRIRFMDQLADQVAEIREQDGAGVAMFIALDNSDALHVSLDVDEHDQLISEIATALVDACADDIVLGRLSEDMFGLLAGDMDADAAIALAETLRSNIEALHPMAGEQSRQVTVSIAVDGISGSSNSEKEVLSHLNRALAHIREQNEQGNAAYLFKVADFAVATPAEETPDETRSGQEIVDLLNEGIKQNSLVLLFQPIVNLQSEDSHEYYEVYLRLPDREGKLLTPDQFVPIAEKVGMGGHIDRWVVLNSLKRLTEHRTQRPATRLVINLTHAALNDERFLEWLGVVVAAAKLPPNSVVLQFAEEAASSYFKQAVPFLSAVKDIHCIMGLSHFGLLTNPLSVLRHLPVSWVKFDTSMVAELDTSEERQSILGQLISRLQAENIVSVVPAIENGQLLTSLFTCGAAHVQGHYFMPPSEEMDFDFDEDS